MAKTASKSFSLSISSQKPPFFTVLMYSLYGHLRYFKFKQKYQQLARPCFQTIFSFLLTMDKYLHLIKPKVKFKVEALTMQLFYTNKININEETRSFCLFSCLLVSLLFYVKFRQVSARADFA